MITYAVSAGIGLTCLVFAALFWFPGNQMLPRVTTVLVMTGVAGLTTTWAGEQAGGALGTVTRLMDQITLDMVDARISGLIAFALVFIVGLQLWRRTVSVITLVAAALLPLLTRSATGDLGNGVRQIVTGIVQFFGGLIGSVTGLG